MQPKRRRVGTGITVRDEIDREWLSANDEPDQLLKRFVWTRSKLPSQNWYEEWRSYAASVLETHGLPPCFGNYYQNETGHWVEDDCFRESLLALHKAFFETNEAEDLPSHYYNYPSLIDDRYQPLTEIAEAKFGSDSTPHFAARIAQAIWDLELSRETNNAPGAEAAAFSLGHIAASLKLKLEWEGPAISGQKARMNMAEARQRGAGVRKARAEEWRAPARKVAREVWRERPELSISETARRVRKRLVDAGYSSLPSSDRAVRDVIGDLSPQKIGSIR